ncbi:uncharacterized protein B4U79_09064 [Dinothrombium tinctorium]|uniref:Zinc finger CCCH domain-containing protein 3 n=2 Tax=Dinothrombium tinctorium TaxID=1965070 RepID=A0A3S3PFA5_9ACAR|nr:uncharacterized protein B4U79_09064 [Dinothrombium tinctorium]
MRRFGFNRVLITRMKKVNKKRKKYCMFFCRYGRCLNSKCPYVHDVDKVAVCTRFLRGKCRINGCLFSHKVEPEKMPVCSFFLRGRCNNDSCPYVHVNVNPEASVCKDFLNGFCEKAQQVKLILKDTRVVDSDDVYFADDCDEFLPSKEWSTLDYDSDDTWIDEEECQNENQAKKPSIRIIPHFLMGTSV